MGQGVDLFGTIARILPERPPPPIDGSRFERVLIVKLSSIGDVVHALPAATALKRMNPALRITWTAEAAAAPIVAGHPAVDRLVVFPTLVALPSRPVVWARQVRAAIRDLRSEPYDITIDLQGLARSAAISVLSRAPLKIARVGQREGAHLVSRGIALPEERLHAVEEYLHVVRALGAPSDAAAFALRPSAAAVAAIDRLLAAHGVAHNAPLIVINPSPSQRWKQWPLDRWVRVVGALRDSGAIVIVGARERAAVHGRFARHLRHGIVDLTGQTTLAELVALLGRATLHLAPDTGTLHIAAALVTPVVAVYGPTRPWRLGPYGQPEAVVYGGDRCGRGCPAYCVWRRRCLRGIAADDVIERARSVLARKSSSVRAAHA
jgi:lipopolysaccharide heptosyltransferase I